MDRNLYISKIRLGTLRAISKKRLLVEMDQFILTPSLGVCGLPQMR